MYFLKYTGSVMSPSEYRLLKTWIPRNTVETSNLTQTFKIYNTAILLLLKVDFANFICDTKGKTFIKGFCFMNK